MGEPVWSYGRHMLCSQGSLILCLGTPGEGPGRGGGSARHTSLDRGSLVIVDQDLKDNDAVERGGVE